MSSFCGQPEAVMEFTLFIWMEIIVVLVAFSFSLWFLALIPILFFLYLWFFEDIPWRGRFYGYQQMPGGGLAYGGEKYECHSCKYIQSQLDCNYGSALTTEKYEHRNDWKDRYPCSMCWRSGASTKQDLYKGPVRWTEGERP